MKTKILSLLLVCVLAFGCLSLTSCADLLNAYSVDDNSDGITKAELDEYLKNYANLGSATVNAGDTYEINVTSDAGDSIISASKALLSAVRVVSTFEKNVYYYWGPGGKTTTQEYAAEGSGVIFQLDKTVGSAYVLTNYHVIYDSSATGSDTSMTGGIAKEITLYLYGQEATGYEIPATYVGGSMYYDLAVLKIENSAVLAKSSAVEAVFADSNDVSVLETAIAIGNPEGEGISVTVGHVNVDSEYIDLTASDNSSTISLRVIRIDAAINSGNSGGGLFNANGELIGIVNAKMSSSSIDNIGYAIPSNVAKAIAANILDYCEGDYKDDRIALNTDKNGKYTETVAQMCVYRCMVGITVSATAFSTEFDTETCKVHKIEDVSITGISDGSIADGHLKVNDIIRSVSIDGVDYEVNRMYNVIDSMLNARIGSSVVFHVERDGVSVDVPLDITASALTAA